MADQSLATIVILARKFNPSIVSRDWLAEKDILTEPISKFVHTDVLSLIEGERFALVLDESRFQLTLKPPVDDEGLARLTESASHFVQELPQTPYGALGFNFAFAVSVSQLELSQVARLDADHLANLFGNDTSVGFSVTFSHDGFVAKAQIPSVGTSGGIAEVTFNFHANVRNAEDLLERLRRHPSALEKGKAIVTSLLSVH